MTDENLSDLRTLITAPIDEVMRLRAENERLQRLFDKWHTIAAEQKAEIDRLQKRIGELEQWSSLTTARFDSRVDRSAGPGACWPWTAGTDGVGREDVMTKRKRMSDVEYHESGQAKQDLYDALMEARAENERLRALLSEARQYVSDAGPDDDSEVQRNSNALLEQIDTILLSAPPQDSDR